MRRVPEPELMDEAKQAQAYSEADFSAPHARFVELFAERFPEGSGRRALDLGCGPADVTVRFAPLSDRRGARGLPPDAVRAQLAAAGLAWLAVEPVGARHLFVCGRRTAVGEDTR